LFEVKGPHIQAIGPMVDAGLVPDKNNHVNEWDEKTTDQAKP
jgi:hypothetical protein